MNQVQLACICAPAPTGWHVGYLQRPMQASFHDMVTMSPSAPPPPFFRQGSTVAQPDPACETLALTQGTGNAHMVLFGFLPHFLVPECCTACGMSIALQEDCGRWYLLAQDDIYFPTSDAPMSNRHHPLRPLWDHHGRGEAVVWTGDRGKKELACHHLFGCLSICWGEE